MAVAMAGNATCMGYSLPGRPPPPHGVHPTQVYDSLLNLLLYVFLAWLYRRKKFDGEIFA
jgi:prolipoprotein diacylglyceryltransferase